MTRASTVYTQIIAEVFARHYKPGVRSFEFDREEIFQAAAKLGLQRPKNAGDVIYTFRFRQPLPPSIKGRAAKGKEWIIEGAGQGRYRFSLTAVPSITASASMFTIPVPDATPEIIRKYALSDEQALLAIVRYNRLIDTFASVTAYPLQSHLRSNIPGVGQMEIDELYLGINKQGTHYVIPVQAKGGKDKIGVVQIKQDVAFCARRFPEVLARPIAVQFMDQNVIAMFELLIDPKDGTCKILEEKHYRLVPAEELSDDVVRRLREAASP